MSCRPFRWYRAHWLCALEDDARYGTSVAWLEAIVTLAVVFGIAIFALERGCGVRIP